MGTQNSWQAARHWVWMASIWVGLGLFDALQTVFVMRSERMHHAWLILFATVMFSWLPWALATPLILRLACKFPPAKPIRILTWLVHLSACGTMGLIFSAWTSWLDVLFNPYLDPAPSPYMRLWFDKFYNGLLSYVVLYAAILTLNYVLDSQKRLALQQTETARLNEQLVKAQLHALRQQIEPHFLFNTLNSVAGLVREGRNDSAVSMIAGLSDLLRRMLDDSARHQVPLREEIEFAQKYLDIQKVRFADRLQIDLNVPSELYPAQVPRLILQPMVENAIKHGIAKRAQGERFGSLPRVATGYSRSASATTVPVCRQGGKQLALESASPTYVPASKLSMERLSSSACEIRIQAVWR
ncbi:histidine kinase [Tunturiibacter empetritectus]|uniref:sensor histidine kinase n=1 Tax=Tunturiibacter empetritectus TaxID=3069691 RepID=UPI003D9BA06C